MTEQEIKLRLIEAAANLPAVRAGVDHVIASARAISVADVWYNEFVKDSLSTKVGRQAKK